jgi:hypothetical protein
MHVPPVHDMPGGHIVLQAPQCCGFCLTFSH